MTAVARRGLLLHAAIDPERNDYVAKGAAFVFVQTGKATIAVDAWT